MRDDKLPCVRQALTERQKERFARQIIMPEIGQEGQTLLSRKRVAIVGCGGLGTPVAAYLAGAGVGSLRLIDQDTVSLSNLPRQIMYKEADLGMPKAQLLAERLHRANPDCRITPVGELLSDHNANEILSGVDLIVSCVDNLDTRYTVNRTAVGLGIPLVEGAVQGFTGLLTTVLPKVGPCYECIFPKRSQPKTGPIGVAAPVAGAVGCMQAIEALKVLLGVGKTLSGILLLFDFISGETRKIAIEKDASCPACGN